MAYREAEAGGVASGVDFKGFRDFGAWQSAARQVELKLFVPGPGQKAYQYRWGGRPCIKSLKAIGTFQASPWDPDTAVELRESAFLGGSLYSVKVDGLAPDFYEYALIVEFENGSTRVVGDPCAKYGGSGGRGTSGFVIDEENYVTPGVAPLHGQRKALKDLIIYELMPDDFTASYRGARSPVAAMMDGERLSAKLLDVKKLGFNAIELMPWTTWPLPGFSWGYDPSLLFAVEYRYVNDPQNPRCKIDGLKSLISACHQEGIQVIMDGVFNHVCADRRGRGFPYYWLYQDPADCPFLGDYVAGGFFQDLDYLNPCTASFIKDVCTYWISEFGVDGLRLDYTKGYYDASDMDHGLPKLVAELRSTTPNASITLEHLDGYGAVDVCNRVDADSCWYNDFYWSSHDSLYRLREWIQKPVGQRDEGKSPVQPSLMRLFDSALDFGVTGDGAERCPTLYVQNHDHSGVASNGEGRAKSFRTQPWAIALFTCYGAVLCHNGQEQGDDYWLPEDGDGRVAPRPVMWDQSDRPESQALRSLYANLARIRSEHPALRSRNFYPNGIQWGDRRRRWNNAPQVADGYGVDCENGIVVYHRWTELGQGPDRMLERIIVALNFSDYDQTTDIPMSAEGDWTDLLTGIACHVDGSGWLRNHRIGSNWGRIFCLRTRLAG